MASRQEASGMMGRKQCSLGVACLTCTLRGQSILSYTEVHTRTFISLKCLMGRGGGGAHTDAGAPHSLGSVSAWAGAVVAASRVLADLIVSALMRPVSALIHVYRIRERRHRWIITKSSCQRVACAYRYRSRWPLWSSRWGTGRCRCNPPVCFYTADLCDTPSACTRLYLR